MVGGIYQLEIETREDVIELENPQVCLMTTSENKRHEQEKKIIIQRPRHCGIGDWDTQIGKI